MKKAIKKLIAALLAVAMLCAMAVPAFAAEASETHDFDAYQIFTGSNSGADEKLGNIQWGKGVNPETFLTALKADTTIGADFSGAETAQQVAEVVTGFNTEKATVFARIAYANKSQISAHGTNTSGVALADAGYYLFVDTTAFGEDTTGSFYGLAMLQVAKANQTVYPTVKGVKPTVTKDVYDNDDGTQQGNSDNNNDFGPSADHAINETFQFRLTAALPANNNFAAYKSYKVIFHDIMSNGITYESIASVKVGSTTLSSSDYSVSGVVSGDAGKTWSLTINDLKTAVPGINLENGTTIEVIYNAHLNENADVNISSGTTTNQNTVYLEYSNNPNTGAEDSTGKTPETTVYVFTYQVSNTKYHDDATAGNELQGAEFRLYSDKECTQEIELYKSGAFYYPIKNASGKHAEAMVSAADGTFNIRGLDAGVYYLRETVTPQGYNTCEDIEITISASHVSNNVTLDNSQNMTNSIINRSGATLPSTGGIGTTIFYVVGGGLMVAAAVLLITKKRMENK